MSRTVVFQDASKPGPGGAITDWDIDFGDNSSHGSGPGPWTHTYGAPGHFNATLAVTSPDGTSTVTHSVPVIDDVVVGGSTDFVAATVVPRPTSLASTPSAHQKPFTTLQGLKDRIAAAVPGDYIYYAGSGILPVNSNSGAVFLLSGFKPSGPVTIDFGTRFSIWDSSRVSGNYVEFAYNGPTSQNEVFVMKDSSNVILYGGSFTNGVSGFGIRIFGACSHITWLDAYIHDVGGSGLGLQPIDSHTGASSTITNCNLMMEVNRCCMNPAYDTHADKGSGMHGCIIHGNSGHFDNNRVIIYAHDPLQPGESSAGHTWPEGAAGSVIEVGTDATGGPTSQNNNTYGFLGVNFKMVCTGNNPGSNGAKQTGGNGFNWWGSVPLNGNVCIWSELKNSSGQCSHGTGGGWHNGSPPIVIKHGRHSNTNTAYPNNGLASATDSYDRRWGIVYQDCT